MESTHNPTSRLNYTGNLSCVIDRLCDVYKIGKPENFSIIGIGYEDCNVIVETSQGKYVSKIFSKERSPETIVRYAIIMEKAVEAGINHPPLIKTSDGEVVYSDNQANGISMVLMDFVKGKTFFELNRAPDEVERGLIIEQVAKVNRIDYHPSYLFDTWAISNIQAMFDKVRQFIEPVDLKLVEQVMAGYAKIPTSTLPHCFVHGDFTKTNVMKAEDGNMYILDFSVSNWYPRIQELAVMSANLFHSETSPMSLRKKTELVANEYNKFNPLTSEERQYLYSYTLAGVAMEFMGAHQEKFIKGNNSEETEYRLNLGRDGLRKELSESKES